MGMTREEAISLLTQANKILVNSNSWLENTHEPLNMAFDMAIKALEERKVGKWVTKFHGFLPEPTTACSECGFDIDFYFRIRDSDQIKYCPNCGARFERREGEE